MTLVHECIPCQGGYHEGHHDVPERGIEGLIGSGWECPCRGECVGRESRRRAQETAERMTEIDMAEILAIRDGRLMPRAIPAPALDLIWPPR